MERFLVQYRKVFSRLQLDARIPCGIRNLRYFYRTFTSVKQPTVKGTEAHKQRSAFQHEVTSPLCSQLILRSQRTFSIVQETSLHSIEYLDASDRDVYDILAKDMTVQKDFLSEEEELSLLNEVDIYMKRLRYEFDHWDNAIHGFRETEKKSWNAKNSEIISRVQNVAFGTALVPLPFVHVLDISKEGYIKPHVDAVRFCGDTIAGMCLLSSCVMRLALEKDSSKYGDIFLPRRCLYIMKGRARYEFTHEVLKEEESKFRNKTVPRDRRISVICRCEPNPDDIK